MAIDQQCTARYLSPVVGTVGIQPLRSKIAEVSAAPSLRVTASSEVLRISRDSFPVRPDAGIFLCACSGVFSGVPKG